MSGGRSSLIASALLWVAIAWIIALAVILFAYAHPLADDFCRARDLDVMDRVAASYQNWSGRWAGIGVAWFLLPKVGIVENYPYLLGGLFLATFATWVAAVAAIRPRAFSWPVLLYCGALLTAFFWSAVPSVGQTIYWATGSFENHLSLLGIAVTFLLMARRSSMAAMGRTALTAGASITAFITTGIHEAAAVTLVVSTCFAAFASWRTPDSKRTDWLLLLAVVLAGAAVTIAAPGNWARAAIHPEGGDMLKAAAVTGWAGATIALPWIFDVKLLALSALVICHPGLGGPTPVWLRDSRVAAHVLAPLVGTLVITGLFFAVAYSTGNAGPGRLHNYLYGVFLGTWLVSLAAWRVRLAPVLPETSMALGRTTAAAALAVGLLISPNSTNAVRDLISADGVRQWHDARVARDQAIALAVKQGQKTITVAHPVKTPLSFMDADLTPAQSYRNDCPTVFYGLRELRTAPE